MNKEKRKWLLVFLLLAALAFAADRYTKNLVLLHLMNKPSYVLIPGVFEFTFVGNTGITWSLLAGKSTFILLISIILILLVLGFILKIPCEKKHRILYVLAGLFMGGAVGNLYDRIAYGYVIDFLYFSLIHFPVFNVADSFIVVSVILLAVLFLFVYKEEDFKV